MSPNKWYYNIVYTTTKGHADYEIRVKVAQIGAKLTQLGLNKARFGLEWVLNGWTWAIPSSPVLHYVSLHGWTRAT